MSNNLSYTWKIILSKLAGYGDEGIDRKSFCELMGDTDRIETVSETLEQMWCKFPTEPYWTSALTGDARADALYPRIRITPAGLKVLTDG